MVAVNRCRVAENVAMSTLTIIGWALVAVGAALVIATMVCARRKMIFLGVGALTWTPVGTAMFAVVGVMMMVLPLTMRRRLRNSRRILEELPPG